jgi:hypothetical protein
MGAGPAQAADVTVNPDTLDTTFTAAPGEENRLEVRFVTFNHDNDTGTDEIPVIEYHDFAGPVNAPATAPMSDYCEQAGTNTVYCFRIDDLNALATINLGDRNDTLREGTPGRDAIYGGTGNDLLVGRAGNDLVDGGEGDDTLEDPEWSGCSEQGGSTGADTIVGGPGTDELMQICRSGFVNVTLDNQANDGSEGEGDNVAGDIEIIEGPGYNTGMKFVGNDLPNTVHGGGHPSVLIGGGGDDKLYGGVDNDQIDGGPGNDITEGWGGADTVDGGLGADDISGEGGSTITDGTGGADVVIARDGILDTVSCGSGADRALVDRLDVIADSGRDFCESVERETVTDVTPPPLPPGGAAATIALGSKSAKVKKGSFPLRLKCTSSNACAGKLSVKAQRKAIGSAKFSIAAGKSKTLNVRLTRAGVKLFKKRKSVNAIVNLKIGTQPATNVKLKLKR